MITAIAPATAAAAEAAGISPTGSAATIPVRLARPTIPARPIIPLRRAIPAAAEEATAAAAVVMEVAAAVIDLDHSACPGNLRLCLRDKAF